MRLHLVVFAAALAGSTAHGGARAGEPGAPAPKSRQDALIELGRRLFHDPVASRSQARSCASCHDPEHGFSDPATRSTDEAARTRRHSQTLLNSHLNPNAHWDGAFDTIEDLVLARLGPIPGVPGRFSGAGRHGESLATAVDT
jgi:cytochrome c peroxidase